MRLLDGGDHCGAPLAHFAVGEGAIQRAEAEAEGETARSFRHARAAVDVEEFGGNEEVYAKVIQAMDAELQDAATRAELAQAGGGCCHIVHELQKRGVL